MQHFAAMDSAIGIIGGTGLYSVEGLGELEEVSVDTPFGEPSDSIFQGAFGSRRVCFLARHGRHHHLLPGELNHRANIWALKSLGVRWLLSVTAVGSLQEKYRPRDLVTPDQLVDRTSRRSDHTFFGDGITAHIAFAEPFSGKLRALVNAAAREERNLTAHDGGVYVNMDGPAFSTRAESELHRRWGFDLIGMTISGEAKLAREAEMAMAVMAFVTDYDCWKTDEEHVSVEVVTGHLQANAVSARSVLARLIPEIPRVPDWPEHQALEGALFTPKERWPTSTATKLRPILERFR